MEEESGEPGRIHDPVTSARERNPATLQSLQQAMAGEAGAPTPEQAAALLEASMDTVRRHLDAHHVQVSTDAHGHIRISASLSLAPDGTETYQTAQPDVIEHLLSELKSARAKLDEAEARGSRLQEELEAAETALEYTKAEVANLWRVMTTRNLRQAARKAVREPHTDERITSLAERRTRIRTKVNDVRALARRRKWPWSLVV